MEYVSSVQRYKIMAKKQTEGLGFCPGSKKVTDPTPAPPLQGRGVQEPSLGEVGGVPTWEGSSVPVLVIYRTCLYIWKQIKYCITRTTLPYNLLINSRISVVLRSDIALLWYYSHPTEIFFETILAIGVKPFGYSRKVFRL